ncbi:hypothetical protein ABGV40_17190 [Paenibacillus amylolyticus]
MIKDLLLAEKKQYEVCLVFEDNSKYIGMIEMSSDKKKSEMQASGWY